MATVFFCEEDTLDDLEETLSVVLTLLHKAGYVDAIPSGSVVIWTYYAYETENRRFSHAVYVSSGIREEVEALIADIV